MHVNSQAQTLVLNGSDFEAGIYMCILKDGNYVMAKEKVVFVE